MSEIERGLANPTVDMLEMIAAVLARLCALSLVLGQTRQQSFRSRNALRISGPPSIIGFCYSLLLSLYGGLGRRQEDFLAPLSHAEVHRDAHEPHVILRIPDDRRSMLGAKVAHQFEHCRVRYNLASRNIGTGVVLCGVPDGSSLISAIP
jgi:hypothetical protein